MDDQLDGKTLVGTYVCTDQPGEFKWQPGSLTQVCCMEFRWHPSGIFPPIFTLIFFCFSSWQAIMNGFWVVLEDIDKAPSDVPLVLSPLLGGSCSFVTSHGEVNTFSLVLSNFVCEHYCKAYTFFILLCFSYLCVFLKNVFKFQCFLTFRR